MLSIRLPEDVEARLERLANETERTKSDYARAVILEKIEDMEDMHLAEHVLDRIRKGEEKLVSADEIRRPSRLFYSRYFARMCGGIVGQLGSECDTCG